MVTALPVAPPRQTGARTDDSPPKWAKCPGCGVATYLPRLRRDRGVCRECGHHARLGARERIELLADPGSFAARAGRRGVDVLGFSDSVPYPKRLRAAIERTGLDDAAVYGTATIEGHPVVLAVMDFAFMGGSMGAAVGETITTAAELALAERIPLLLVTASGGARMQEGAVSLMQMAKTSQALVALRAAAVPSICLLTDPTYGGVTASFATLGDVLIAESRAAIGFAGPNVVEKSTGVALPSGFQRAEYLLEHGMLDRVEPRSALRGVLGRLLAMFAGAHAGAEPAPSAEPCRPLPVAEPRSPWQTVRTARDLARPTTTDYVAYVCDDFIELHGDRLYGDDTSIVGGLATVGGRTVMVIGHQKGHDTREMIAHNFGMPHPEGYRKALRLMRVAERHGIPVVTFVDTQGAHPGLEAEQRGQGWAIADSIAGMSELAVPIVSVIVGEGGSGGALALAVADRVLMMAGACYSVISPESCSTILFGDPSRAEQAARALRLTAEELYGLGIVDDVLPEPGGGTQAAPAEAAATVRHAVLRALGELRALPAARLRSQRFDRFRRIGRLKAEGDSDG